MKKSILTLVDVMSKTRHELANYRDIIEISERIKRSEPKKDAKDRIADDSISRKQGFASKASSGASFAKEPKVSNAGKPMDLKDVECFKWSHRRTKRKRNPSDRSESDI